MPSTKQIFQHLVDKLPIVGVSGHIYYITNPKNTDLEHYVVDNSGFFRRVGSLSSGISVDNFVSKEKPTGVVDGLNNIFTLQYPVVLNTEHVFINGVLQEKLEDYTINESVIKFLPDSNPQTGFKVRVSYFKQN